MLEASPGRVLMGAKVEWKGAFTNYLFDIKFQRCNGALMTTAVFSPS